MSTRAQIAIQIGPEEWAHIYVHYDGYPSHMLPALAPWTPEDILAARKSGRSAPTRSRPSSAPRPGDPAAPDLPVLPPLCLAGRGWVELDPKPMPPKEQQP
jgi:hypothetical protein